MLDDNDTVSTGSRAICFAKRTLEIWDRLGVRRRCSKKASYGRSARSFSGDEQVYQFNLQPEGGHKMPAFINLQQYYVEEFLVDTDRRTAARRSAMEEPRDARRAA